MIALLEQIELRLREALLKHAAKIVEKTREDKKL
jgi:hypothetical protein